MRLFVNQALCLALLAVAASGCGQSGGPARVKVYKVTGKVTFFGSPLIGAVVSFSPTGTQPAAIGRTNDSGTFTLTTYQAGDGAAAGDFKVLVMMVDSGAGDSSPQEAHFKDQSSYVPIDTHAAAKRGKGSGNVLPSKYGDPKQSPLNATVDPKKSENTFTFDLK